jgi:hypothetical protein
MNLALGGTSWGERFASFFNVGLELGLFISGAVRVGVRGQIFPAQADDTGRSNEERGGLQNEPSEPPTFLYGGSLGYALAKSPNFVLSPGVVFMRTDVAAYGNFLGLAVPFEWVQDSGFRIGFEVALGRTFDGDVRTRCVPPFDPTTGGQAQDCVFEGETREEGAVVDFDRPAGVGFYAHFEVGFGFNRPKPLPNR